MDSNPNTVRYPTGADIGADLDGMLPGSSTNQQPPHDEELVTDPPSSINIPRPEDMSCASSVTTRHFYDEELFVPRMYPSLQNVHDTDVQHPTLGETQMVAKEDHDEEDAFLMKVIRERQSIRADPSHLVHPPSAEQTKPRTEISPSGLPPLPEELSQDPADACSKSINTTNNKLDEIGILKELGILTEQEKSTKKEESSHLASMATLESKINQKTQVYSVQQISSENKRDTAMDPVIQKEHIEDELEKNSANEDEQGDKVLWPGQNKDPVILDGGRNPAVFAMNNTEDNNNTLPSSQSLPGPRDQPPAFGIPAGFPVISVPGAHPVSNPFGTSSQQRGSQNTAVDEEEGGEDSPTQTLAEAQLVAEGDLPIATADGGNKQRYRGNNLPFCVMGGIFCILVVAAIVIGAVCSTGHCSQNEYVDGSSTIAPTTTRDAVDAPKIEIVLTSLLGKNYFRQVEEGYDSDLTEFMLERRQKAFDWIVNQDPMQLEYDSPNLVQRFLFVLFYYQTTRHQRWKECNPPATSQGSTSVNFCYMLDRLTGETTVDIWGDQWLTKSHECQWGGVTCETVQTKEKTAVGVSVRWNQLNGPLPWEIAQLPHLKQLQLNYNMLSGMLPPKLLSFSLEELMLGSNQLSGPIPARWFDNLHDGNAKLTSLQIHKNRLTGSIPSEVGLFPLELVNLQWNQLSGSLPVEFFSHTSLRGLYLGHNDLTGTFPSEFGLLTSLKDYLQLVHTHISGTLPSEIALLSTLKEIDLSFTNMQGTLPEEMYTGLTDLGAFSANNCNFSGTISSSIGHLTSLQLLHVANNNFHGTFPNEIEELTGLSHLVVNGNQFSGTVPISVCHAAAFVENFGGTSLVVADCLPNAETGAPKIECSADCCTSCCGETGVCLSN